MASEIKNYIEKAREKKLTNEQIENNLITAGWQEAQIAEALSQDADLLVPPPPPSVAHVGMWTGFLYIIFFISLYVLATAIAGILHIWIDKTVPDWSFTSLGIDSSSDLIGGIFGLDIISTIRGYLAAIIVSYPLFLVLSLILNKQLIKQPAIRNLRSRKLLIYITLIGTFLIMLGNVIATSYDFLSGTVTLNIIGHLLVTILIAGSIFVFFISEVKHDSKTK